MTIAIAVRTDEDVANPVVAQTAVHVDITGLDAFNPVTDGQYVYRLVADAPSGDDGQSHVFTPSQDGKHSWDNYIFPVDGSWTLRLWRLDANLVNDSEVATQAVTVAAS